MKTYMTNEEFLEGYIQGLRAVLSLSFNPEKQHHLEDLLTHTTSYSENVFQFVTSMPYESRPVPRPEPEEEEND
jgi:hypothetical protein